MTFQKYPLKIQIILGLIFTVCNILISFTAQTFHWAFFMDMIFVYAGSFLDFLVVLLLDLDIPSGPFFIIIIFFTFFTASVV